MDNKTQLKTKTPLSFLTWDEEAEYFAKIIKKNKGYSDTFIDNAVMQTIDDIDRAGLFIRVNPRIIGKQK